MIDEQHGTCRHRTLAHGPVATIQQCTECGALSMHLGAVTLRVDASAAEAMWATLGEALHAMHRERAPARPRAVGSA